MAEMKAEISQEYQQGKIRLWDAVMRYEVQNGFKFNGNYKLSYYIAYEGDDEYIFWKVEKIDNES